jgi:hypothetical protein
MRKPLLILAALIGAALLTAAVAAATTTVSPSNAPSGTHFADGSTVPTCTVAADQSVTCGDGPASDQPYVLGGVGHTDASLNLTGKYTESISCTNNGKMTVVAQQQTGQANGGALPLKPDKNGQLTVPATTMNAPATVGDTGSGSPCPNHNWTWTVQSVTLNSYDYTLTFDGFPGPYIEITGP